MRLHAKSRREMDAAHATHRQRFQVHRGTPKPPANIDAVLALGEVEYFQFRGHTYRIAPLSYKAAQRLVALQSEAHSYAERAHADGPMRAEHWQAQADYFQTIGRVADLLWSLTVPVGWVRRLGKATRILANPFRRATEEEVLQVANFFHARRTKSYVRPQPMPSRSA